jgi:hypothetical protein
MKPQAGRRGCDEASSCLDHGRVDRHRPSGGSGFCGGRQPHVASGRHEEAGHALATELRALGSEAEFIRADVRHENAVRELVDRTVARFGRLDAAVKNAGTEGHPGPVTEQSADRSAGDACYFSIPVGGEHSIDAVWTYETPYAAVAEIKDHLAFYPDRVDAIESRS